ncbi:MAG TPA: S41 family peptidase [Planctomycetaceae bacterium]|nr:S41 family peptidase [Planctomycetaceae bacterium]
MLPSRLLRWAQLAALVLFVPAMCPAQFRFMMKRNQPPLPIDEATSNAVIDGAIKRLEAEYVFPDVAAQMTQLLRNRQADKAYAGIKTGQALAQQLTKDLQAVSKDKHLRIICSTEKLPKLPGGSGPNPDPTSQMKEEMRQMGQWMNAGYRKVERLGGNVGYLALDGFLPADAAVEPAAAAVAFLANTDALIIDLRRNGGGEPESVALLCSYFFGSQPVHINSLYSRKENKTTDYWTRKEVAGKRYLGKDVYVLIGPRTFSGAEEFAYDLQTQKRAVLVGETTGGGAHPGDLAPLGDHFAMFVPTGRAINPITKTDWEGTGVKPDVAVPADKALEKAHELAIQKLVKNAKDDETRQRIQMDVEHSRERPMPKATAAP